MSDLVRDNCWNSRKFTTVKECRLAKVLKEISDPNKQCKEPEQWVDIAKEKAGTTCDASSVIIYLLPNIHILLFRLALLHMPMHFLSVLHLGEC